MQESWPTRSHSQYEIKRLSTMPFEMFGVVKEDVFIYLFIFNERDRYIRKLS